MEVKINKYYDKCSTELSQFARRYFDWMVSTDYSIHTVESRAQDLKDFLVWAEERSIHRPQEVSSQMLESYRRYLHHCRKPDGNRLNLKTQHLRLVAVKGLFKWLAKSNFVLYNPAADLDMPRLGFYLPRGVFGPEDIEKVFESVDLTSRMGIRDRAILELLYSSGLRRREMCNLKTDDINFFRGTVMVRQGKWKKDRLTPVGSKALFWIDKYLSDVRPDYVMEPDEGFLFLGREGTALSHDYLSWLVSQHLSKAGIGKKGMSCHSFRHSMATQMLEGGADIRYVQEMLGHTKLDSTQIYTRVSIKKLKEVHAKTHPGADVDYDRERRVTV